MPPSDSPERHELLSTSALDTKQNECSGGDDFDETVNTRRKEGGGCALDTDAEWGVKYASCQQRERGRAP
jgi:hypothetical protein